MKTVNKIKLEAFKLFAKKGYEETSMREIAKKTNIKAASIYSHYNSKEDLFTCIFKSCIEKYDRGVTLEDEISKMSLKEKTFSQLKKQVEFLEENPLLFKFLIRTVFFPPNELKDNLQSIIDNGKKTNAKNYYEIYNGFKENGHMKDTITIDRIISIFDICILRYFIGNLGLNYYKEQESIENIFESQWREILAQDG